MELLNLLAVGFAPALLPALLLRVLAGFALGAALGAVPGLGPLAVLALLTAFNQAMPGAELLVLLLAAYCGAHFARSAALPQERPMRRRASGPIAPAASALAAACLATLVLAAAAQWLAGLAGAPGAAEALALMVLALALALGLAPGSLVKALAAVLLGLLLGLVGPHVRFGLIRFALDLPALAPGIHPVLLALGLLGCGEAMYTLVQSAGSTTAAPALPVAGWRALVSRNAAAQAACMPLLALGLPVNASMALVLAAMARLPQASSWEPATGQVALLGGPLAGLCLVNLVLVLLQRPLRACCRLIARVPYRGLFALVLLACAVAAFALERRLADVWLLVPLALLGYLLRCLDMPAAPLLLGFVLAPHIEDQLRLALQQSGGDWSVLVLRPYAAATLLLALGLLLLPLLAGARLRQALARVPG